MSSKLESRRKQFYRIVSKKSRRGHSEAITWWLAREFSEFNHKEHSLKFEFMMTKDMVSEERKLLQEYFKKHAEPPPLNAIIPQRTKWYEEMRE